MLAKARASDGFPFSSDLLLAGTNPSRVRLSRSVLLWVNTPIEIRLPVRKRHANPIRWLAVDAGFNHVFLPAIGRWRGSAVGGARDAAVANEPV